MKFQKERRFYFLILLAGFAGSWMAASPAKAISETKYETTYAEKVKPFLRTGHRFVFTSKDGIKLQAVSFKHSRPKGVIVFLNGRTETWLKYGETFYDLFQKGYTIVSYDHRGQGLSQRLIQGNPQIGHVEHFGDYLSDFQKFMEIVIRFESPPKVKLYLMAHSLGGAIAAQYLLGKNPFSSVVMTAPLFQIYTQPESEEGVLAKARSMIDAGQGNEYFPGRGNYKPEAPFETNPLTSSKVRFELQAEVWKVHPDAIVGGQSNRWMYEVIQATKDLSNTAGKVFTPILLFQAGNDRIASPARQNEFCENAKHCRKVVHDGSKHHLLLEQDVIRDAVLLESVRFFSQH